MRLALAALTTFVLAFPGAAGADAIEEAVEALVADPVYVDSAAERAISPGDADRVRARIRGERAGPLYIAILPEAAIEQAGGEPEQVVVAVAQLLDRDGTYAVIAGKEFRAGSTVFETGTAQRLGERAFRESRDDGVAAVLLSFVDAVGKERNEKGGTGTGLYVFLALLIGALALVLYRRRGRSTRGSTLST